MAVDYKALAQRQTRIRNRNKVGNALQGALSLSSTTIKLADNISKYIDKKESERQAEEDKNYSVSANTLNNYMQQRVKTGMSNLEQQSGNDLIGFEDGFNTWHSQEFSREAILDYAATVGITEAHVDRWMESDDYTTWDNLARTSYYNIYDNKQFTAFQQGVTNSRTATIDSLVDAGLDAVDIIRVLQEEQNSMDMTPDLTNALDINKSVNYSDVAKTILYKQSQSIIPQLLAENPLLTEQEVADMFTADYDSITGAFSDATADDLAVFASDRVNLEQLIKNEYQNALRNYTAQTRASLSAFKQDVAVEELNGTMTYEKFWEYLEEHKLNLSDPTVFSTVIDKMEEVVGLQDEEGVQSALSAYGGDNEVLINVASLPSTGTVDETSKATDSDTQASYLSGEGVSEQYMGGSGAIDFGVQYLNTNPVETEAQTVKELYEATTAVQNAETDEEKEALKNYAYTLLQRSAGQMAAANFNQQQKALGNSIIYDYTLTEQEKNTLVGYAVGEGWITPEYSQEVYKGIADFKTDRQIEMQRVDTQVENFIKNVAARGDTELSGYLTYYLTSQSGAGSELLYNLVDRYYGNVPDDAIEKLVDDAKAAYTDNKFADEWTSWLKKSGFEYLSGERDEKEWKPLYTFFDWTKKTESIFSDKQSAADLAELYRDFTNGEYDFLIDEDNLPAIRDALLNSHSDISKEKDLLNRSAQLMYGKDYNDLSTWEQNAVDATSAYALCQAMQLRDIQNFLGDGEYREVNVAGYGKGFMTSDGVVFFSIPESIVGTSFTTKYYTCTVEKDSDAYKDVWSSSRTGGNTVVYPSKYLSTVSPYYSEGEFVPFLSSYGYASLRMNSNLLPV